MNDYQPAPDLLRELRGCRGFQVRQHDAAFTQIFDGQLQRVAGSDRQALQIVFCFGDSCL